MSERRLTDAELEASRWIARLDASDVTLEDHQRFRAWLAESEENRAAHEAVSRTWDKLDALRLLVPRETARALPGHTSSRRALVLGAAGAIIAGGGALAFFSSTSAPAYAASFETPVGGRQTVRLPDGSQIELNTNTRLQVAFDQRRRIVTLDQGEAYFVAHDDQRPFTVLTPFGAATSNSATFVVRLLSREARASVVEGELRLTTSGARTLTVAAATEEALLSDQGADISSASGSLLDQRLAWREGILVFNGEPLRYAADEVARQTGVTFRFKDPSVAELRIGGAIRADDLDAFIDLVQHNLDISARREGMTIVLG